MAKKNKEIHANKSVKYLDNVDAYTIQLKKRRKFWWLLLLLLPLLLLIKCERTLTVHCYDAETKAPIEGAEVTLKYESHYVFDDTGLFPKYEYTENAVTDEEGLAKFENTKCSVFCYIFHLRSEMEIYATSDCYDSADTTLSLHCHKRVGLPMKQHMGLPVCVEDKDTHEGLPGAIVKWERGDQTGSIVVDDDGYGLLPGLPACYGTIDRIDASSEGYYDTTYYDLSVEDRRGDCVVIKMRPKVENYHVDIVMCIDNTGSMSELIDLVKNNALKFHSDLKAACAKKRKKIEEIRLKVLSFGDLDEKPIKESEFLLIPSQSGEFRRFVDGINAWGGDDSPEDALETIAMAIKTGWSSGVTRRRHIVIMYTDAPAHDLGYRKYSRYYPADPMPKDFEELTEWWNRLDAKASRFILFAPDEDYWSRINAEWPNVFLKPLEDVLHSPLGYDQIIEAISNSL